MNLHKRGWTEGLKLEDFAQHKECNETAVKQMLSLASSYTKSVQEEINLTSQQLKTRHVGKQDPKRHLQDAVEKAMGDQVSQSLAMGVLAEVGLMISFLPLLAFFSRPSPLIARIN